MTQSTAPKISDLSKSTRPTPLAAVPFTGVQVNDAFWSPRIRLNAEKVLPHNFRLCEETGRIANFSRAAGAEPGGFEGIYFNDSDIYKVIEGAAYSLHHHRDPQLERLADEAIEKIAAAQQPDGYLNTYFTLTDPSKRWTNLKDMHELYCAGHLIEAAVAYHQATGKRKLLDVACRFADHIDSAFGPEKRRDVCGHEEIELALVKLWKATGEDRYFNLARFFIDERGHANGRKLYGEYAQDHKPVRAQRQIVGHAVRAMYLYCAMADVAAVTDDRGLIDAMDAIWGDLTGTKMYVTGGIGSSAHNEGFTLPYDLPNETAYAETCAAIGMALWNHRLTLLHADAKYADLVELVMFNGLLSGISLDGERFFYVNPLASRGDHHRKAWFGCACCPPNVARFLPTVGGYIYATGELGIYIHHYIASTTELTVGGIRIELAQHTNYPWEGSVAIDVNPASEARFTLWLRVPGWARDMTIEINGSPATPREIIRGYMGIDRTWRAGDRVYMTLPTPIERLHANPKVVADLGRVALRRGPIIYCVEAADHGGHARDLVLPPEASLHCEHRPDLLGGVTVVKTKGRAVRTDQTAESLYTSEPRTNQTGEVDLTAVPYYAWDNRSPGEMAVWLPEHLSLAEPKPDHA